MKYLAHIKNNKDEQQISEIEKHGKIIYISDVEVIRNLEFVYKI